MHRRPTIVLVCLLLVVSGAARAASPTEEATAQALFDEGMKLLDDGRPDVARPKFEMSIRLAPTTSAKAQLARCFEALGLTASAWVLYDEVATESDQAHMERASRIARSKATTLKEKLSYLTVRLSAGNEAVVGLSLRRDELEMGPAAIGVPVPIDPGTHEISVSAPGFKTWRGLVEIPHAPGTQELNVSNLEKKTLPPTDAPLRADGHADTSAGPAIRAPAPSPNHSASEPEVSRAPHTHSPSTLNAPPPAPHSSLWVTAAWAGLGVGATSAAIGAVVLLSAKSSYDDAAVHCGSSVGLAEDHCTPDAADARNGARDCANASTWLIVGGTALAATSLAVLLVRPRLARHTPSAAIRVGPSAIVLEGSFQ